MTIHVGVRCLFYARRRLCDRDIQVAANRVEFPWIDPAIDHPIAVRADALKRAGGVAGLDAVDHFLGGHLGRAARQTVDAPRPAGLLGARPALSEGPASALPPGPDPGLVVAWR